MKRYIRSAEEKTNNIQKNSDNFYAVFTNFADDVNNLIGHDVLEKVDEYSSDDALDVRFKFKIIDNAIPDFDYRLSHPFNEQRNPNVYLTTWGDRGLNIAIDNYSHVSSMELISKQAINDCYDEMVDSCASTLGYALDNFSNEDIEELYQDWYQREIEPNLLEAFPECNFYGRLNDTSFSIIFSKKENPDYNGSTLRQDLVRQYAMSFDNIQSLVETGEPLTYSDDYVLRLAKKLISKGIEVNRDVISQKRKEAREAKDASIDMNAIHDYMYENFSQYLNDQLPEFNPNLLSITNIKPDHRYGRTDFKADLTYDGMKVKIWMPFEYEYDELIPYEDKPMRDVPEEVFDMMYEPLIDILEAYEE